jgi:hypothetical protein
MDTAKNTSGALIIFISYASEDETLLDEFEKHLNLLQRQDIIKTLHRRKVLAGADWKQVLDQQIENASVILLLISADFMASNYRYSVEMKRALARHDAGTARVIPVLLCTVSLIMRLLGIFNAYPVMIKRLPRGKITIPHLVKS